MEIPEVCKKAEAVVKGISKNSSWLEANFGLPNTRKKARNLIEKGSFNFNKEMRRNDFSVHFKFRAVAC